MSWLISLIQILRGQTLIFFHHPVFSFQRGCGIYHFSLGASTDKTYFHADLPGSKFPNQRVKDIMRTSGEIDFRFRLKLKMTLLESTYPSQRLNGPLCPHIFSCFSLILFGTAPT